MVHALAASDFDRLKRLDAPTVANAIERLNVRLRNEGFIHDAVRCLFPRLPPMLGYAVTGTIRSSSQPIAGGWYYDRLDWWKSFLDVPAPRVMVLQDVDRVPAFGAFVGEIHANIAAAFNCVGCVTDGAVRDLPDIERLGFQLFAAGVSPSHAYAHVVEWGDPVEIGGLRIQSGDLVQGDCHGVQLIPLDIAAAVPDVAEELRRDEQTIIAACQGPRFSVEALAGAFEQIRRSHARSSDPAASRNP